MVRRNGIHLNPRTRVGRYPSGLIPYYAHFDLNITYIGANLYSLYLPTYVKVCSIYMHEQAYIIIADASSIVWDVARCVGCDKTGFLYNIRESADLFRHACFNPRTRVGCDIAAQILFAPHLDFNPRTRVGCDGTAIFCGAQGSGFQSTHPRGVRHIRHHTAEVEDIISIHAPAWGATHTGQCDWLWFYHFNPRTRVGCDSKSL